MSEFFSNLVRRELLAKAFGQHPRLLAYFENQGLVTAQTAEIVAGQVGATQNLQDATVVTLSPNDDLTNEFVLKDGDGTVRVFIAGVIQIDVDATVARAAGGRVTFNAPANVTLFLPTEGTLVSDVEPRILYNKSLDKPKLQGLKNASNDGAAATAGVPVGGIYSNSGALRVRLT